MPVTSLWGVHETVIKDQKLLFFKLLNITKTWHYINGPTFPPVLFFRSDFFPI